MVALGPAKITVFVHSYCMSEDVLKTHTRRNLSMMAEKAMHIGLETMRSIGAQSIIASTAYPEYWQEEAVHLDHRADEFGLPRGKVSFIGPIENSYDEARGAVALAKAEGADRLVVIAERWHARRSRAIFKHVWPGHVDVVSFTTPYYERTVEPSKIKSLRSSWAWSWILWNFLFGLVPPSLMFWLLDRKKARFKSNRKTT